MALDCKGAKCWTQNASHALSIFGDPKYDAKKNEKMDGLVPNKTGRHIGTAPIYVDVFKSTDLSSFLPYLTYSNGHLNHVKSPFSHCWLDDISYDIPINIPLKILYQLVISYPYELSWNWCLIIQKSSKKKETILRHSPFCIPPPKMG